MESKHSHLQTASLVLNIPVEALSKIWAQGKNISIPSMVELDSSLYLQQKTFFLLKGITREYFVDDLGSDHTLRIIQGPAVITPSLNNRFSENETVVFSQSLTSLEGRIWDMEFMFSLVFQDPVFFQSSLKTITDSVKTKMINDIRRHECSAQERYQLFIKEFPGATNFIPLKYIASYLNMTPETISRIRNNISKP